MYNPENHRIYEGIKSRLKSNLYHSLKAVYNQFSLKKRQTADRFDMEIRSHYMDEKLDDYFYRLDRLEFRSASVIAISFFEKNKPLLKYWIEEDLYEEIHRFTQLMEEYHLFLEEYPQVRKQPARIDRKIPKNPVNKERALLQEKLRSLEAFLK